MAGKRGNNEGSIKKRDDGRWEARLTLEGGKRKSYYAKTRQEAARMLVAATRDRDNGLTLGQDERQKLTTFLYGWMERVKPTIRPRTWIRYRELLAHASAVIGQIPVAKLTPMHVEKLYAEKLADGLSSTTVHHMHTVLHHALDDALRKGIVHRNVCELVDAPKVRRHPIAALTPEQALTLLEAARKERLEALFVVALTTGLREG